MVTLSPISNSQQQQAISNANAKVQAVIASLVAGTKGVQASDNVSVLSVASQLQAETVGLKQISGNLAQATSLTQVADNGVAQIQNALTQLQGIAAQASSPVLNDQNRKDLNAQFQKLAESINQIVGNTSFNGKALLNGSVSGNNALSLDTLLSTDHQGGNELSISDLSTSALFNGGTPDLLTAEDASQAFTAIGNAINDVTATRSNIGAFQQTLDFAAANIDSAVTNQEAARSELQDTDFADASTQNALADLQRNAGIALAAQGNRLAPVLLKLIG